MKFLFFLVFSILCLQVFTELVSYKDYHLISVEFKTKQDIEVFQTIFKNADVFSYSSNLVLGEKNYVLLSPENFEFLRVINHVGFKYEVIESDYDKVLSSFNENLKIKSEDFYDNYRNYSDIIKYMKELQNAHQDKSTIKVIGKSLEDVEMYAMIVTAPNKMKKRTIWISGLQHAREWIVPPVVFNIIRNLLEKYDAKDPTVIRLMNTFEFHFIPVINVDGYLYTWTKDRMWRKNRRPPVTSRCYGVDLNRNWPYQWGGAGASKDECSETYMGKGPSSEPEITNIINYSKSLEDLVLAVDYHSYSQLILRAWQYTSQKSPDEVLHQKIGAAAATAIKAVHGQTYRNIRGSELYVHSGSLVDFFYFQYKIPAFTVELRPTGSPGFILPPSQIKPTMEENWEGFLTFCSQVL
jgi:murein tripeptide amidase MpaA